MTGAGAAALFATMLVLSFVPGPTEAALVARSTSAGIAHGLAMVLGIVLADFVFIAIAVAGLTAIADALGPLFLAVRLAAGLYLVALGIRLLRASLVDGGRPEGARRRWASSLLAGFALTLGDPKAILGYMSLLPAFVDLPRLSLAGMAVVMLLAASAIGIAKTGYLLVGERAASTMKSARATSRFGLLAGATLACVGLLVVAQGLFAL